MVSSVGGGRSWNSGRAGGERGRMNFAVFYIGMLMYSVTWQQHGVNVFGFKKVLTWLLQGLQCCSCTVALSTNVSNVYWTLIQASAHTGWQWSGLTITQSF